MKKVYYSETPEEKRRLVSIAFSMEPIANGFYFINKKNVKDIYDMSEMVATELEECIQDDEWLGFDASDFKISNPED